MYCIGKGVKYIKKVQSSVSNQFLLNPVKYIYDHLIINIIIQSYYNSNNGKNKKYFF